MKIVGVCLIPEKYEGKNKNTKENDFLIFCFIINNTKENKI